MNDRWDTKFMYKCKIWTLTDIIVTDFLVKFASIVPIFVMYLMSIFIFSFKFEIKKTTGKVNASTYKYMYQTVIRDGPSDIRGGCNFFEKNSSLLYRSEKNKMSSTKLKIKSLFFIQ